MAIKQLNPALEVVVDIGDNGKWQPAIAHALIDYGIESDLFFVTFLRANGGCWIVPNYLVRGAKNISAGRTLQTKKEKSTPEDSPRERC